MSKVIVGIRVDDALMQRLRNAVWHLGKGRTITSVLSEGIEKEVARLEALNGGKPYPPRRSKRQALEQRLPGKRRSRPPLDRL